MYSRKLFFRALAFSALALAASPAAIGLALIAVAASRSRRKPAGPASSPQPPAEPSAPSPLPYPPPSNLRSSNLPTSQPSNLSTFQSSIQPPATPQPLHFILLTFALTIPFYMFGGKPLPIPMKLPISALAAFNPMIAAALLTWRQSGGQGVKDLFRRVLDYKKIKNKAWYLPVLLLNPLVFLLSYAVMRRAGLPLPEPSIPWDMTPALFLLYFIFGIGEELGWMGYAADPLLDRWGVLRAGLILGVVWAAIHLVPDLQNQQEAGWIFWHRLGTVVLRVLIVWIYAHAGRSVFSSILIHVVNNLSWTLFPNYGSHYDPMVTTLLLLPATVLLILTSGWKAFPRAGTPAAA